MAKINDATTWRFIPGIPPAGTTDQALTKTTGTDYDAAWDTLPALVPGLRTTVNTAIPNQLGVDVSFGGLTGGDTLTGGIAASETLTLASTGHATRGTINLRDPVLYVTEDKTLTTAGAFTALDCPPTRTITATGANIGVNALRFAPTVVFGANSGVPSGIMFALSPIYRNDTSARNISVLYGFNIAPTMRADTATVTGLGFIGIYLAPVFDTVNSGTLTETYSYSLKSDAVTVNAGATVANYAHIYIGDVLGTGTISGLQIGLDIGTMAKAASNIGIRNAAPTVFTQTSVTITAVTDTIPATATVMRLNNTSGSSKTLTSTPTIPDGQQNQVITLLNTSVSDVVLQDQGTLANSNLRLGATTRTLTQRDSISLMYSTNVADWVETGFSNVL